MLIYEFVGAYILSEESFFSINYGLLPTDCLLEFDLYVNSSSHKQKQKFVRLFPKGEMFDQSDLDGLKSKYPQLYVPESQRNLYMRSMANFHNMSTEDAVVFIKDSAIKYLHTLFDDSKEFTTELLSETIDGCRDAVESMIDVLDDYNIDSLRGLIGNLSGHDFYTYDHSINVSMYCITILRALNPKSTRLELMHAGLGGLLHDLGKLKIPTTILNNPGGLTDEEFAEIKKHPNYGIELLKSGQLQCSADIDLDTIARIIHEHHENWDGTGYPNKLKDKEIHLLARVCCIADFFDAVTTKRSYNQVLSISQAIDIMEKTTGKKLDPKVFKVFTKHVQASKVKSTKQLKMADSFDPSVPYAELPLEEVEEMFTDKDFGQIRFLDEKKDTKNKKDKK